MPTITFSDPRSLSIGTKTDNERHIVKLLGTSQVWGSNVIAGTNGFSDPDVPFSASSELLTYPETPSKQDFITFQANEPTSKGGDLFRYLTPGGKIWISNAYGTPGNILMTEPQVNGIDYPDRNTAISSNFRPGYSIYSIADDYVYKNNDNSSAWIEHLSTTYLSYSDGGPNTLSNVTVEMLNETINSLRSELEAVYAEIDFHPIWIIPNFADVPDIHAAASANLRLMVVDSDQQFKRNSDNTLWTEVATANFVSQYVYSYVYIGLTRDEANAYLDNVKGAYNYRMELGTISEDGVTV